MTPEQLAIRDEILQVLFWMAGEELGQEADAAQLAVWLTGDAEEIAPVLATMTRDGLLHADEREGRYRLSELGRSEGGRRFSDSFAGLSKQGHGECAPGCDCLEHGHEYCQGHDHPAGEHSHPDHESAG